MTLLMAIVTAIVFGSGIQLVMSRDLTRVVMGLLLVSNASNLFLMSVGLTRGAAPMHPVAPGERLADPLVQAMTLTAIVIGFGTTALLLALLYRVQAAERTLDADALVAAERRTDEAEERSGPREPSE